MSEVVTDLIPQRAPFLFVDKIIERHETKILTSYQVLGSEDFFKGHFPGNPIMPGVLLQEALFQTGACLMANATGGGLGVVTKVSNARFKSMVKPGDELVMEVELVENLDNAFYFKGKTKVSGKTVLSIEFTCASLKS
ncbi:3-hydroxyacyl-ACP dehydratase FabZ [Bacteriovorax sp. Seq25_V]|uniref:3-hydroxyacyl-ACP dehydratase FabZ n=1 Tax=Bacteriovorax sp. Seq25_V TaxID=1201288 RepID=UPI00038A27DD|nr:3-hydroxyacyl-ACP dehydratase FabZ [Bacteriovorax sp. Seq25_V]EQC44874.1 FabA-like domain protein [Bacteriovorax sp. Seq25_V]